MRFLRYTTTLLLVIGMFLNGYAQDVTLTTQAEVDAFDPTITVINGNLYIAGSALGGGTDDISNLDAINNVTSITGNLTIRYNYELYNVVFLNLSNIGGNLLLRNSDSLSFSAPNLINIGGSFNIKNYSLLNLDLSNLSSINENFIIQGSSSYSFNGLQSLNSVGGSFEVLDNDNLTSIGNFPNLNTISGNVKIGDLVGLGGDLPQPLYNPNLVDISGLSNLSSIGGYLSLKYNGSLENLSGLENITDLGGDLIISSNYTLSNLDGLIGLQSIEGNITITNNNSLSNCCGIKHLLLEPESVIGNINISGNPAECSSESDILGPSCGGTFNLLQGNVFLDANDNCSLDAGDQAFEFIKIEVSNIEHTYITLTDALGNYQIYVDSGTYEVKILMEEVLFEFCSPFYTATFENTYINEVINIDIPITALINCPKLEINLSTPILRECLNNNYTIQYCNQGTENAIDAYIELALDDNLLILNAELPFTGPDENNIYTFLIGDVNIGDCADFLVNIQLPCIPGQAGEFLGQTLCVDAHIYPNEFCFPASPNWDGSSTKVISDCVGDSVQFRIINKGAGDMQAPRDFHIIEDQVMMYQSTYQLLSGEEFQISFLANGSTYRLEAEQAINHPGNSNPSIAEESCLALTESGPISLGMINQFPQDEADPFVSIECTTVTGSYDPNDKQGFPIGYGEEHYIEKNTDIEYLIRFQNTGTDTAFTVVITDIISPLLDISTIDIMGSSHAYTFEAEDSLVIFTFDDILLVDSFANEPASHGFIKYSIAQNLDLANGTVIENTAKIYFDFNPAIITNTTFHTIGENFVTVDIIDNVMELYQIESIQAYPNPFVENITFELEGLEDEVEFILHDISGREVFYEKHSDSIYQFNRGNLNAGIYFYSIKIEGNVLVTGKIVLR